MSNLICSLLPVKNGRVRITSMAALMVELLTLEEDVMRNLVEDKTDGQLIINSGAEILIIWSLSQ